MARLNFISKKKLTRNLPNEDKMRLALQWLRENPTETTTTAARCHSIANEHYVRQAWRREKRNERQKKLAGGAGHNNILSLDQH
jgi:hypothetical protein